MGKFFDSINVSKQCRAAGVGMWECPHFLFPLMGCVTIVAILATYVVAIRYAAPEITALIVLGVAAMTFVIGTLIVHSFENVVEMTRLKSEFVSVVSHELRSPLSAIRWSMELMSLGSGGVSLPPPFRSLVDSVREQAEKMNRLVNTLLEVRRAEDKELELQPEAISMKKITSDALAKLTAFARATNVRTELDAADGLPAAYGDPKKIGIVIENLIDNAIRYSGEKKAVTMRITPEAKTIIWRVEDAGSGIPKEDAKNIFQPFYRSHNEFRYRAGGLGVGLYLARAIIEASRGSMHFESRERGGSAFWFVLPLASAVRH